MKKTTTRIMSIILCLALILAMPICACAQTSNFLVNNLQSGDTGSQVETLQLMLNRICHAGLSVDGKFSTKTANALCSFQGFYNLAVTGTLNQETRDLLNSIYLYLSSERKVMVRVDDRLNVRSGPSQDFEIIGAVYDEEVYSILAEENGWILIQTSNQFYGWINASFTCDTFAIVSKRDRSFVFYNGTQEVAFCYATTAGNDDPFNTPCGLFTLNYVNLNSQSSETWLSYQVDEDTTGNVVISAQAANTIHYYVTPGKTLISVRE